MSYRSAKKKKIRRSKSLYGNRRREKRNHIIALVITLVVAGGLVFFGYSIGKPIIDYIRNDEYNSVTDGEVWTPPEETVETTAPEVTEKPVKDEVTLSEFMAYELEPYNLTSLEALEIAVTKAEEEGYNAICVTLKERGGYVYFGTEAELAHKNEEIIRSTLPAKTIASKIKSHGMLAIAKISTLHDNVAPFGEKASGYLFEGQTSSWYDNSVDNGGKPWLSPFSDITKTYISQLAIEAEKADFDAVICSDVVFPILRNSDIEYIGEIVRSPERYKALLDTVGIFEEIGKPTMLEVSAAKILSGTEEVFRPSEISEETRIIVELNLSELPQSALIGGEKINLSEMSVYDRTRAVLDEISGKCGDREIIPHISSAGVSEEDFNMAKKAVSDMNFTCSVSDGVQVAPAATTVATETPPETATVPETVPQT